MEEFEAVKKIMDVVAKNWAKLAPDTRVWIKSRLDALPTDKVKQNDEERERV